VTVTITVRDTANVAVPNAVVTLNSTPALPPGSTILPATATADGTGTVSFTVTVANTGTFTLSATAQSGTNIQALSPTVTLNVYNLSAPNSSISALPSTVAVNGTSTVTVSVKDDANNPVPGATVNLSGASSIIGNPQTTNSSGDAIFVVSHNTYGTITLSATATKGTSSATSHHNAQRDRRPSDELYGVAFANPDSGERVQDSGGHGSRQLEQHALRRTSHFCLAARWRDSPACRQEFRRLRSSRLPSDCKRARIVLADNSKQEAQSSPRLSRFWSRKSAARSRRWHL
jgi:hypothetical protein